MASGRDPEANWQEIIQIQVDAGLNPGTPLSETLDHLLRPIFQQDGSTPGQPPYHASQQTFVILVLPQVEASVLQEIMSQNQPVPLQPHPPGQLETQPNIMQEGANTVHASQPSPMPTPFPSQVAQVGAPTDASPRCPVCEQSFGRPQERNRHARTHLPLWLFCPFLGCSWRSDRSYTLATHWTENHSNFGEAPRPEDCKIYNPDPLVQSVISGELLIEEATAIALQAVRIQALEQHKVGIWEDEWGRRRRARH